MAVAALAVFGMWGINRVPVTKIRQRAVRLQGEVVQLVQIPALPSPPATSTRKPVQQIAALPATTVPARTEAPTAASTPSSAEPASATSAPPETTLPAPSAEAPTVAAATIAPTQTPVPSPTATAQPTATTAPTATAQPTATQPPSPAPATNKSYTVVLGDSLALIGEKTGMDWQAIASANNITQYTMLHPGDKLALPAPLGGPAPTTSASQPATYTVQSGDSLALIGERYGVPWEDIARANRINQYTMLQPGMKLIVPLPGQALPTNTTTPTTRPTARPVLPTATPVPAPSLPAPTLVNPADGTPFGGGPETFVGLTWRAVDGMPPGAMYRLTIKYVANGLQQEQNWNVTSPGMPVPSALWGIPDRPGRWYMWYVTVVQIGDDGKGGERVIPLSPPSAVRSFSWE